MKNIIIFTIGSFLIMPSFLLISSENIFSYVLSAFWTTFLIVTGALYFRAFWRKFFNICWSFDDFLKSNMEKSDKVR